MRRRALLPMVTTTRRHNHVILGFGAGGTGAGACAAGNPSAEASPKQASVRVANSAQAAGGRRRR